MAADVHGVLNNTELGYGWAHAVTSDGRVFFVNEYDETTTWVSPVTGEPVQSGHSTSLGLPRGWEIAHTPDGHKYYIDHNNKLTTFINPITGAAEAVKSSREGEEDTPNSFTSRMKCGYYSSAPALVDSVDMRRPSQPAVQANQPLEQTNRSMSDLYNRQPSFVERGSVRGAGRDDYVDPYANQPQSTHVPNTAPPRQQGRQGHGFPGRQQALPPTEIATTDSRGLLPFIPTGLEATTNPKFLTNSPVTSKSKSVFSRSPSKKGSVKRQPTTKRMQGPQVRTRKLDVPISMSGWLHKFESGSAGVRKWKLRYFVLQDFCLYTYKDTDEAEILDSILLPSYKISLDTKYKKPFGFKAEHENTKTHYFAAPHEDSLNQWVAALERATNMQRDAFIAQDYSRTDGDGTESPNTASPYHDQRKDRLGGPPQYYNSVSPVGRSPSARGHSLRSPEVDGRWTNPPATSPYDQQVRERSYTPPIPQYSGDYEYHPGFTQPSAPADNLTYDEYNSYNSPQPPMERRNSQPYPGPGPAYARMNEYGGASSTPPYAQQREPVRGRSVLMAAAGHEHGHAYRNSTDSAAYNPSYSSQSRYDVHAGADNYQHEPNYQRANGVSVRGEPRTPPSVVTPPWKRDNPQTPTYRPPHYENLPATLGMHNPPSSDKETGSTPTPPRPEKLTYPPPADNVDAGAVATPEVNEQQQESVCQPNQYSIDPQKWRDELQARTNTLKRVDDPLIFQFPVPYRQPDWRQGKRGGHEPINFRRGYPPNMSNNNSNNNVQTNGHDGTFVDNAGVPAFKPPPKVNTHSRLTNNELVGKSHEELVLLLIELRREQSQLESSLSESSQKIGLAKIELDRLQGRREDSASIRRDLEALEEFKHTTEQQLEAHRPLINLVDNMVKRSGVSGDIKADRGAEKRRMMEFSRQLEERDVSLRAATAKPHVNPAELDSKMESLNLSEQRIQKHSNMMKELKNRMRGVEDELMRVTNLLERRNSYPLSVTNQMLDDKQRMESDLSQIRQRLTVESRNIEQMNSQRTQLQREVMSLKSQLVHSPGHTGENTKLLQRDVEDTQRVVDGLRRHNKVLSEAMDNVRQSHGPPSTYFETDIDTMATRDLSLKQHNGPIRPSNDPGNLQGVYKPKPMSMRDMKRASASRQEQRETERPVQPQPPIYQTVQKRQQPAQKPRPVSAYEPRGGDIYSQIIKKPAQRSTSVDNKKLSASSGNLPTSSPRHSPTPAPQQTPSLAPWDRPQSKGPRVRTQARRKENRARYQTISSSQPVELESANIEGGGLNTARSSTALDYTHNYIDDQISAPEKVHIPERYVPDSSDDEENISPEEQQRRAEKAEQIRKMVATQSLQEFSHSEITAQDEAVDQLKVNEERKRREVVLEMRHAVAKEVTRKSKESQEVQRMRSKSHENLSRFTENC